MSIFLAGCAGLPPIQTTSNQGNQAASTAPVVDQQQRAQEDIPTPVTGTGSVTEERLLPSGWIEIGSATAPVSVTLFTNHECAYCRTFHAELLPRLSADFIRTGQVRVTIAPLALKKYSESRQSAAYVLCSARQNKGMAMHDLLFRSAIRSRAFTTELAALGLSQGDLQTCLQDSTIQTTIDAQQSVAQSLGVTLVPDYFINGTQYIGLPEYADLRGQVQKALGQ